MKLNDIPRNDFKAATAYYKKHKPITADEYEMLSLLQDDVRAFLMNTQDWQIEEED